MTRLRIVGMLMLALLLVAGCAPQADIPATVAAAVAATQAALPTPAPQVTTIVQQMTVEVPVPVTVVVAPTEAPTQVVSAETPGAATPVPPGVTASPQVVVAGGTPAVVNGGPDPLAGSTGQIFNENFTPGAFWAQGDDEQANIFIADDELTIEAKQAQRFVWTVNTYKDTNFYLQAVVRPENCKGGDNYGVVLRSQDDNNLLLFGVSCDGRYRLLEFTGGTPTPLVDWTASPNILMFNWINTLGVRAQGNQIGLYVNNYYLTTVTTGNTAAGRFGLYVGNVVAPGLIVHFDDVTAWRIGN